MTMFSRLAAAARYLWTGETPPSGDGRPMNTDLFLTKLLEADDLDHYDREEAINAWCHGEWKEAVLYLDEDEPEDARPPLAPGEGVSIADLAKDFHAASEQTNNAMVDRMMAPNPILASLPMKPERKTFFADRPKPEDEQ